MLRAEMTRTLITVGSVLLFLAFTIYRITSLEQQLITALEHLNTQQQEEQQPVDQFKSIRWYIDEIDNRRRCNIDTSLMGSAYGLPIPYIQYRLATRREVPNIIHQIWPDTHIPVHVRQAVLSWREHNPDWEYWLWTEDSIRLLISRSLPQYLSTFRNYPLDQQVREAARWLILYKFGGVYADIDVVNFKPLRELLENRTFLIAREHELHSKLFWNKDLMVNDGFIASTTRHPFVRAVVKELRHVDTQPLRESFVDDLMKKTGPFMVDRALEALRHKYGKRKPSTWYGWPRIAPSELLFPSVDINRVTEAECYRRTGDKHLRSLCEKVLSGEDLTNSPKMNAFAARLSPHSWMLDGQLRPDWAQRFGQETQYVCKMMKTLVVPGGEEAFS